MPLGNWNTEFINLNSQRRYPLAASASGIDTSGTFTLPNSFLAYLDFPVAALDSIDPSQFFIRAVGVYAAGVTLIVSYNGESGVEDAASAMIPSDGFIRGNTYALGGINNFSDSSGKVAIWGFDDLASQPAGYFQFVPSATQLDVDSIRPIIRGVSALYTISGGESSQPIYGDVQLVAGENIQLTPVIVSGQSPQIIISAINGEGLSEPCVCAADANNSPCITHINGVPPTAAGDFSLLGDACISIAPSGENGLQLSDLCSSPCCGCQELERITQDLQALGTQAQTVNNFVSALSNTVMQLNNTVLSSTLNDQGCIQSD